MDIEAIKKALGLPPEATEEQVMTAIKAGAQAVEDIAAERTKAEAADADKAKAEGELANACGERDEAKTELENCKKQLEETKTALANEKAQHEKTKLLKTASAVGKPHAEGIVATLEKQIADGEPGSPVYQGHPDVPEYAGKYPDKGAMGWVKKIEVGSGGVGSSELGGDNSQLTNQDSQTPRGGMLLHMEWDRHAPSVFGILLDMKDLKEAYKTIEADHFAPRMEISFIDGDARQTFQYEKVTWNIGGEEKGLRYGENPGQEAALYRLVNGNLVLGDVEMLQAGQYLASVPELLQSGKHPGKTNVTDTDNALNILRYLMDKPCAVIVKHNNPCGVATGSTLAEAYFRANKADRLAAFGGAIALNRDCDMETAKLIVENYAEVVVAPDFAPGVMDLFATKKNLRVFRIRNMSRLTDFVAKHVVDFKSLIDGGIVAQTSFSANARKPEDFMPACCNRKITNKETGEVRYEEHRIARLPTTKEYEDLVFGWLVEAGVTSNSVLYVKDGATVGIGTGEQDRVGVAEIARDKAYTKHADWISWEKYQLPFNDLRLKFGEEDGAKKQAEIMEQTQSEKGGLPGCAMVSDAFFPFRDGLEVGIREGITSVVQPGGALRDWDVIDCANDAGVAMVFTGQRSFRH